LNLERTVAWLAASETLIVLIMMNDVGLAGGGRTSHGKVGRRSHVAAGHCQ
jgi:hypothetical protein